MATAINPRTEEILDAVGMGFLILPMRISVGAEFTPTIEFAAQLRPLIAAAIEFVGPVPELQEFMRLANSATKHNHEQYENDALSDLFKAPDPLPPFGD